VALDEPHPPARLAIEEGAASSSGRQPAATGPRCHEGKARTQEIHHARGPADDRVRAGPRAVAWDAALVRASLRLVAAHPTDPATGGRPSPSTPSPAAWISPA
jgi:hypothetical protein